MATATRDYLNTELQNASSLKSLMQKARRGCPEEIPPFEHARNELSIVMV